MIVKPRGQDDMIVKPRGQDDMIVKPRGQDDMIVNPTHGFDGDSRVQQLSSLPPVSRVKRG